MFGVGSTPFGDKIEHLSSKLDPWDAQNNSERGEEAPRAVNCCNSGWPFVSLQTGDFARSIERNARDRNTRRNLSGYQSCLSLVLTQVAAS